MPFKAVDPEVVAKRGRTVIKQRIFETKGQHEVCYVDGNDILKMLGFIFMEPLIDSAE